MKTVRLVAAIAPLILLPVVIAAFNQSGAAESPTGTAATSAPPVSPSIVYIEADDVSGSMGSFIDAVRGAAADQLRKLLPGDAVARIEFDSDARLVSLTPVHDAADVENVLKIDLGPAKGKKTEISRGLLRARQVAATFATGTRRIVLVLATDGDLDPRDSIAAERQRLVEIAAWWKGRSDAAIVMVAPNETVRTSKQFVDLAMQLGARTVGLEEFRYKAIVTREIEAVRPTPRPSIPARLQGSWVRRVADVAAAALVALALGGALLFRWRRRRMSVPPGKSRQPATGPRAKACVLVTAAGSTREVVFDFRPYEVDNVVTIGGVGSAVELPGYRGGLPITVTSIDGISGDVRVPEGVTASLGADPIDSQSGPIHFIRGTVLKTSGAHIQIRLVAEGAAS